MLVSFLEGSLDGSAETKLYYLRGKMEAENRLGDCHTNSGERHVSSLDQSGNNKGSRKLLDMDIFCGRANSVDEWIGFGGEEEEENQNDCKICGLSS